MSSPVGRYDKRKFVPLVVLHALAVFVLAFNSLWNIPHQDAIVIGIIFINACLGAYLAFRKDEVSDAYGYLASDGSDPDTGIPNLRLMITRDLDELLKQDAVVLKVLSPTSRGG